MTFSKRFVRDEGEKCDSIVLTFHFPPVAIVGGLLTLVNMGPGGLSVDEQKKIY